MVIPKELRNVDLEQLHSALQGITKMKPHVNQLVYWPGMDKTIKNYIDTCSSCSSFPPSQPAEPIILTPLAKWPFQQICMDYFSIKNHSYLSITDHFSGCLCTYYFKHHQSTANALNDIC